jgi:superfamily II DNA or RNA helicase
MRLRSYQSEAIAAIETEWANDRRATLLVLPTGCGKTVVFTELLRRRREAGRALVLAHRGELLTQAANTIRRTGLTVEVERAESYATRHGLYTSDVVVASVATLHKKRLHRWPPDGFATVVVDECFPAGTMVGGRPIETLRAGDMVPSFDEASGEIVMSRVVAQWSRVPSAMVRVRTSAGVITCTPNHPFLTARGWIPAAELIPNDEVMHNPEHEDGVRSMRCRDRESASMDRSTPLLRTVQEGRFPARARVDRVEVLQPGRGGTFGGVCPDGRVYNLEIELTHTYLANGFVVHNCHHATAASWRSILEHFAHAQILGVTATPDRGDKVGLGAVFDSVAYEYQLRAAITDGWLVPIRQHAVQVADLDLSDVRSTRGDLSESDLQRVMSIDKVLHEIAAPLVELRGDRPTLVFGPGVEWAHAFAEVLGGYLPASRVRAIDGTTPQDMRAEVIGAFKAGELDVLVNVGVLTEGFDAPNASCIAMCRPTRSRALYCQILGRGTRPLPGVVDGPETPEERRAAIAESACPDALVLDFRGNAGRHSLVTPLDVLAGKPLPEDVRKDAERAVSEGVDVESALAAAEERGAARAREDEERRARQHVQAKVAYTSREVSPFSAAEADPVGARASAKQQEALARAGYRYKGAPSERQARHDFAVMGARQRKGLCTRRQAQVLHRAGVSLEALKRMTKSDASALIDRVAANGWRMPVQEAAE